ncbi:Hypothetical predicted protein [Octopus vulgaris]|uniref:Uncharacterized protein n=1 Tax=Octopus vulgaris TaxID=6645 RepID=A0AA36AR73_OCTVU|nr:Hypothetical predicted protein [Octopus vulgaris]
MGKKKKESIEYANILLTIRPVPRGEDLSVPGTPTSIFFESDEESGEEEVKKNDSAELQSDPNFDETHSSRPHLITQGERHDHVKDLQLPENKAGLLGYRLQQWNLLIADVKISKFNDSQQQFGNFFIMESDSLACKNINGLMEALDIE